MTHNTNKSSKLFVVVLRIEELLDGESNFADDRITIDYCSKSTGRSDSSEVKIVIRASLSDTYIIKGLRTEHSFFVEELIKFAVRPQIDTNDIQIYYRNEINWNSAQMLIDEIRSLVDDDYMYSDSMHLHLANRLRDWH